MPSTKSPLRYPGGKTQFVPLIKAIINQNKLDGCEYLEPFAGGSGVGLRLLFDGNVDKLVLNDRDPAIFSFWESVLHDSGSFCELIDRADLSVLEWKKQKAIYLDPNSSVLERGFAAFYLNRTNRSGIIKANPIGGLEQKGNYNLGCRFPKENLKKKISLIASKKDSITFENLDASEFIIGHSKDKNSFWFIDPPYYEKGKQLYSDFYDHEGHVGLSETIASFLNEQAWVLTYDVCEKIKVMYKNYPFKVIPLNYSVCTKRVASELMFFNKITFPVLK